MDTIEDEHSLTLEEKRYFFDNFIAAVDGKISADAFATELTPKLTGSTLPAERELVRETSAVLRCYCAFSSDQQAIIRRRFVYLCTNGILVSKHIDAFKPSPYLTFNIHLDGLRERHDALTSNGVFDQAVEAIRLLTSRGFRVTTNTTLFLGETAKNVGRIFDFLTSLGVEAMTVAPGFNYDTAPDQHQFLTDRRAVRQLFGDIFALGRGRGWRFNHSSLYLDFLAGGREYSCTPWGNPTFSLFGWQRPCYLLNEGYAPSFADLLDQTDWSAYGPGRNPKCASCMVHCGFEPSAVIDAVTHPFKLAGLQLHRLAAGKPIA